ncbi:hypothetical protein [Bacteroides sp. 51]|uniref:hypothetical protein n=1 Tax=Bacteroides sp. 51 TaxID=2302938 RepID=UPI0013D7C8DD|nr:hypothetical protein [Bacteroides sp. 51]NDV83522.1 hypothetical protein [Bacteroides sp. 51]
MIVISPTEFRSEQKKYLDLAETEEVVIKRSSTLVRLVVEERTITDEDLKEGLTAEELLERVRPRIKKLFDK